MSTQLSLFDPKKIKRRSLRDKWMAQYRNPANEAALLAEFQRRPREWLKIHDIIETISVLGISVVFGHILHRMKRNGLHDRRGHLRKLASGKTVWIKQCKVGKASLGTVFHDYEVRAA